ncbi:regulator of initiation factor 2 (eIF2) [Plasmodium gaboni]|uniref:Regulator of initiation factor 2 (eIF2) n=1 Tax=Plasmodium gaboni TaxID=647221 RepID=A0ABY1UI40_9APIC|nr:regulator of initiation factor 2 (eIF2) [Plasmodium gaboni]
MSSSCYKRDKTDEDKNKEMNENIIYLFDDVKILLNTFIYLFILRYFKNVEIYFNSYKLKESVVKDFRDKVDDLFKKVFNKKNVEKENIKESYICDDDMKSINVDNFLCSTDDIVYKNKSIYSSNIWNILNDNNLINEEILDMNKIFKYVKCLHLNMFLLLHTNDKNLDYPYNLLNIKMDLYLDEEISKIYSSDSILINKKWNGDINTIFDNIEECGDDVLNKKKQIEIVLKQNNICDEIKKEILNNILNIINYHCIGTKEMKFIDSLKIIYNKNFCNNMMLLYKEKKKATNETNGDNYCNNNYNINSYDCNLGYDLYYKELIEIINNLIYFLFEDNFYNASISKQNKICYKRLYEQFNKIMIKSKIIKLNEEMISYLLIGSIFIPDYVHKNKFKQLDEDVYSSFSSYSEQEESEKKETNKINNQCEDNMEGHTHTEIKYKNNKKNNNIIINNNNNNNCNNYYYDSNVDVLKNEETDNDDDEIKEDVEYQEIKKIFENKNFRLLLEDIENEINKLNNSVFLRINHKNVRGGCFVNNYSLEVNTLYDALLILKSSTSIYKMIKNNIKEKEEMEEKKEKEEKEEKEEKKEKKDHYLILSKYVNINICFLFDVYVYDNNIIGISQKYLNYYFSFLNDPDIIIDSITLIKNMFEKNLKNKFFCNNYIFQVYIHTFKKTKKKKLLLINLKSWLYKNKHPYFTNRFLKYYIFTEYQVVQVPDEKYMSRGIYKYKYDYINKIDDNKMLDKEKTKDTSLMNRGNENDEFDFYFYDDILYYCIIKNDSIYKKNSNIYPKDLNYIKEGEIDIDNLMETMKRENNIQ